MRPFLQEVVRCALRTAVPRKSRSILETIIQTRMYYAISLSIQINPRINPTLKILSNDFKGAFGQRNLTMFLFHINHVKCEHKTCRSDFKESYGGLNLAKNIKKVFFHQEGLLDNCSTLSARSVYTLIFHPR